MFSSLRTLSRTQILAMAALGCLTVLATWILFLRVRFELAGAYHTDVSIYMTVSRGILNGLRPYADLYENKTPGIFLLGALSLRLFNGVQLLLWLQALVLLLFPFCLVLPVLLGGNFPPRTAPRVMFAWLLGCALALYAASMAGTLLPESFGAFFGSAFVALAASRQKITPHVTVALALLFLLATGFKEPFFLSTLAGTLLVLPSFPSGRRLLPSVLLAIAAGVQAMVLLGYLIPYVTIDLRHLLGFHVYNPWGTVDEPLWLRTIDIIRVARNMAAFNPALPFIIGPLWVGTLLLLLRRAQTRSARLWIAARWLLASWFTTLSVGLTGDFYGHHFIFAVPLYTGCVLVCLREWNWEYRRPWVTVSVSSVLAVLLAAMLLTVQTDYSENLRTWEAWAQPRKHAAAVLDTVMDRCSIDRYFDFIDRPEGFYGFTRHSPYGPIFTEYGRFIGVLPVYLAGFDRALQEAKILVMKTEEEAVLMDGKTRDAFRMLFTETPPSCAGADFDQPLPYRILFRKAGQ